MIIRVFALSLLAVLLLAPAFAGPPGDKDPIDKDKVDAIIAGIDWNDPAALSKAEDALVALGEAAVPALKQKIVEQTKATEDAMKDPQPGNAWQIQQTIPVLDNAVIRLTWKLNPTELINAWLGKLKDFNGEPFTQRGQQTRIMDEPVAKVFPQYLIYSVRYRSYPVARILPEPLKYSNLFVIGKDKTILHIADTKALEQFFRTQFPPRVDGKTIAATDEGAKQVTYSWLRLSSELANDGMFQFTISMADMQVAAADGGRKVTGKAVVKPVGGNSGEICATVQFTGNGALVSVEETRDLKPGMRPICQATKLLDPDDIVRRMAEQDLLVMGRAAESYLVERRALATPALQAAIDRIWARIVAENR